MAIGWLVDLPGNGCEGWLRFALSAAGGKGVMIVTMTSMTDFDASPGFGGSVILGGRGV